MRHIFFLKRNHLFVLHSIQSWVHSNSKSPGTKRFRGVVVAIDAFRNRALIAYTTSQPNAHKAISVVNCSHFSHRFKQKQRCGSTEARAENIKVQRQAKIVFVIFSAQGWQTNFGHSPLVFTSCTFPHLRPPTTCVSLFFGRLKGLSEKEVTATCCQ